MKKDLLKLFFLLVLFFAIERFCHKQTHGFSLQKIASDLPLTPANDLLPNAELEQIRSILTQPYFFLDSGGEFYVFASQDDKYVIKFFKHHHMRKHSWVDCFLPKSFQEMRQKKLRTLFSSCRLAFTHFGEETGLIYPHLSKTDHLQIPLTLFDPIGVIHTLDLDKYEFLLQKKAEMAYPKITKLVDSGNIEEAKFHLTSLLSLALKRCNAGIADHDARKRNFGFIGNQAVEIDLGSFSADETLKNPEEMKKVVLHETKRLKIWIQKNHPQLSGFLEEKIRELVSHEDN